MFKKKQPLVVDEIKVVNPAQKLWARKKRLEPIQETEETPEDDKNVKPSKD